MHFSPSTIILAIILLLGGCGQMGPLYEPEESAPTTPATPAPAPAPAPAT